MPAESIKTKEILKIEETIEELETKKATLEQMEEEKEKVEQELLEQIAMEGTIKLAY